MAERVWIPAKVNEEGWLVCARCGAQEHSVKEPIRHKPGCEFAAQPPSPAEVRES